MGECINLRRGGKKKFLPILNANYPADVTVEYGGSASFKVEIAEHGYPEEYTYQWYLDGQIWSGATSTTVVANGLSSGTHDVICTVTNEAGMVWSRNAKFTVGSALPNYTFNGSHKLIDDGNGNWRLELTSTGTLNFTNRGTGINGVDIFLVGGGAGGRRSGSAGSGGGGGGGGYTKTVNGVSIAKGTNYGITIGAGGGSTANGGNTIFNNTYTANGGTVGAEKGIGGNGGSGGGAGSHYDNTRKPGAGGSDGSDGGAGCTTYAVGIGQHTTTREFGVSGATLYSGGGCGGRCGSVSGSNSSQTNVGGAGGGGDPQSNATFYGGGGGGGNYQNSTNYDGGSGYKGIIIIRNKR